MSKRAQEALTVAVALILLAAVAALVYIGWDRIVDVIFSPIGGLLAKVVLTGKVLKIGAGVVLAIVAIVVGVTNHLKKRDEDHTEPSADAAAPGGAVPGSAVPAGAAPGGAIEAAPVFLPPQPDEPQVERDARR
jgi:hypothetical protein